jgi:hypothetical protein
LANGIELFHLIERQNTSNDSIVNYWPMEMENGTIQFNPKEYAGVLDIQDVRFC